MKVVMAGYIETVGMKVGQSADLVKQVRLEVHGDIADLEGLMKQPLMITFETKQLSIGEKPE